MKNWSEEKKKKFVIFLALFLTILFLILNFYLNLFIDKNKEKDDNVTKNEGVIQIIKENFKIKTYF